MALLKDIVDFYSKLIEEKGPTLLRDKQAVGDPADVSDVEEAPSMPRGKGGPETKINIQF